MGEEMKIEFFRKIKNGAKIKVVTIKDMHVSGTEDDSYISYYALWGADP